PGGLAAATRVAGPPAWHRPARSRRTAAAHRRRARLARRGPARRVDGGRVGWRDRPDGRLPRRPARSSLMRPRGVQLAFPGILAALVIVTVLGDGLRNALDPQLANSD